MLENTHTQNIVYVHVHVTSASLGEPLYCGFVGTTNVIVITGDHLVSIHPRTHTHSRIHTYTYSHTHKHTHAHTHSLAHTHTHTHTHMA